MFYSRCLGSSCTDSHSFCDGVPGGNGTHCLHDSDCGAQTDIRSQPFNHGLGRSLSKSLLFSVVDWELYPTGWNQEHVFPMELVHSSGHRA